VGHRFTATDIAPRDNAEFPCTGIHPAWHIGFTVQNRYTWGIRGSFIPLLQRIMLNFIWTAIQCMQPPNSPCSCTARKSLNMSLTQAGMAVNLRGKLVRCDIILIPSLCRSQFGTDSVFSVCITAIWPSFAKIPNTLSANTPTTTYELIGFTVFWFISVPFLFIRPERFKKPFFVSSVACGCAMVALMIWSLSVAKGVGPVFHQGQTVSSSAKWNVSWLMLYGINQAIGGKAAGMTNSSDFSRYATRKRDYIFGTVSVYWLTGILVCLGGLVTTAACQKIYGEVYWNPPDLLMVMMDREFQSLPRPVDVLAKLYVDGQGSSAARAGVFFASLSFAFASMFENVCSNSVAGGIELSGLFPRYIDIRRGSLITFFRCMDHSAMAAGQQGSHVRFRSKLVFGIPGAYHGSDGMRLLLPTPPEDTLFKSLPPRRL
jgi:nucleobase:cation symporter-1, NCS1 family